MDNHTISIFGSKIFLEIINEVKLFSKFKIKFYNNLDLCIEDAEKESQLVVFFVNELNPNFIDKIKINNFPLILVVKSPVTKNQLSGGNIEQLDMPFTIFDFKKNSLIHLSGYIIDKNERNIKKDNLELQLSEKEINFLILFAKNKEPISKNLLLKNVWKYSAGSETHTVETHIHRLRKKILKKFNDRDFIKNNNKGYYI